MRSQSCTPTSPLRSGATPGSVTAGPTPQALARAHDVALLGVPRRGNVAGRASHKAPTATRCGNMGVGQDAPLSTPKPRDGLGLSWNNRKDARGWEAP